jgi:hypothetical protein
MGPETRNGVTLRCPPQTALKETLLEFFGHQRKLQLRLGQRLHHQALRGFRGCISRRRHLAENLSRGMFRTDAQHDPCWSAGFSF